MALGRGQVSLQKVSQSRGLELSEPSTPPVPSTGSSISHREGCPLRPLIKLLIHPGGGLHCAGPGGRERMLWAKPGNVHRAEEFLPFSQKGTEITRAWTKDQLSSRQDLPALGGEAPETPRPPSSPQSSCLKHLLPHCLSLVNFRAISLLLNN